MFRGLKRKAPAERILYCFVALVFLVVALSYVYIFLWTLISSLKTHTEIVMNPFSLPEEWKWSNYLEMAEVFTIKGNGFFKMLFNSIWFSVAGSLLMHLTTITFAYTCTKYTFPGSKLINSIILIMISLPIYGNAGAVYRLYYNFGLIDTYAHVLVSMAGFNVQFLYYRAFFKNLSNTYMEAAKMDGADHFQTYFRIMFPQSKPIFTALFLTTWLASWNSYESAMVYLPNLPTLPVGIYQFNTEMIYRARLDILFGACVIVSVPALILFIVFNKTLTTNVSVGGIKG